MSDADLVELRGMCPREVVDVLDAVSVARRMSRIELTVEVLRRWADERIHEADAIRSVTRCNGSAPDTARIESETTARQRRGP